MQVRDRVRSASARLGLLSQLLTCRVVKWTWLVRSIHKLRRATFILYNSADWHAGTDYQRRRAYYASDACGHPVVSVDLNSLVMVRIVGFVLGCRTPVALTDRESIAFARADLDASFRTRAHFPGEASLYESEFASLEPSLGQTHSRPLGKALLAHERCAGIMITQAGLDEWPWALMASWMDKDVFEPEGHLGSTVRTTFSLDDDQEDFERFEQDLWLTGSEEKIRAATMSLENRCRGDYTQSPLGGYMNANETAAEATMISSESRTAGNGGANQVLFLHAMADAANGMIYDYRKQESLDYFHQTLQILDILEGAGIRVAVKHHPLAHMYPGERAALEAIDKRIAQSSTLEWASQEVTIADLAAHPGAIAMSARGSVLLEAASLGVRSLCFNDCIYSRLGFAELAAPLESLPSRIKEQFANDRSAAPKHQRAIAFEAYLKFIEDQRMFKLRDYGRASTFNSQSKGFRRIPERVHESIPQDR